MKEEEEEEEEEEGGGGELKKTTWEEKTHLQPTGARETRRRLRQPAGRRSGSRSDNMN